eukprot:3552-Heterococcus_DN1.PRE.2
MMYASPLCRQCPAIVGGVPSTEVLKSMIIALANAQSNKKKLCVEPAKLKEQACEMLQKAVALKAGVVVITRAAVIQ